MSRAVIEELCRLATKSYDQEVRLEAIRSLAIYRTDKQAEESLIHLAKKSNDQDVRLEAIRVMGGQYDNDEDE